MHSRRFIRLISIDATSRRNLFYFLYAISIANIHYPFFLEIYEQMRVKQMPSTLFVFVFFAHRLAKVLRKFVVKNFYNFFSINFNLQILSRLQRDLLSKLYLITAIYF